jgi:hypothetical protein
MIASATSREEIEVISRMTVLALSCWIDAETAGRR